ncbi:leucine-rich repeat-containing G-protein coupled receptor 5 isoform X2 [Protopterus annectens]|uniref:leucine-rich repeat-containing G-protein coupled receptor 5 isoform X2 n=1 Tax=Protopterus annectens TaxID=7888 RepID=UPI001CFBE237|nr:leucine-rich repeat-containing G-protein coupled receptor 5 isoform X2 [Protopterus annectens]
MLRPIGNKFQCCLLLLQLVLISIVRGRATKQTVGRLSCPSPCHCDGESILLKVDCSDLGLNSVPANLSRFTSYLDLSMNNFTELRPNALATLHFLEEIRLAGNGLTHIPKGAFSGLFNLKVLMLQNNQLRQVPSEAFQNLHNLQSLRLDANHISYVPPSSFDGLVSLRHLWLDDNSLAEIPVKALSGLSSLQAMTLALNKIVSIPDYAFKNLSRLVVLHLHNNRIQSLGKKCFEGLQNLETLDLNYNNLIEFPTSIKALSNLKELGFHSNSIKSIPEQAFVGNPALITIHFYDNPIQFVGKSAFQHLPELRTLTLTGAQITTLPMEICDQLPNLQVLDLSYNLIQDLPSFNGCQKLQKIDLRHNEVREIRADTFQQLTALCSLDLAWNKIAAVHPSAFSSLPSLMKLDITSNLLSSFPVTGLHGLTHLKLAGNHALQDMILADKFPHLRSMEMPYAYQCCAFGACENLNKLSTHLSKDENSSTDDIQRKDAMFLPIQDENDFEDFLLDFEEDPKAIHSVQCSPSPGPFKPCDYLFRSWLIRVGVWVIALLSLTCNSLVITTIFRSPICISSSKILIGLIAITNICLGSCSGILAVVDALTYGSFAKYGARWENGAGCQVIGLLSVFASQTCIFLLTTASLERGFSLRYATKIETRSLNNGIKIAAMFSVILALIIACVPLFQVRDYGISPLCFPLPFGNSSTMCFMVALVLLNSFCFLVMTISYIRLYCNLDKEEMENIWDCSMTKHIAWLLLTNCVLYCPVAFLTFSSLFNVSFINPEVIKSIILVIAPLPACLNPLLYVFFNPHFKEDFIILRKQAMLWKRSKQRSFVSINSDDAEKLSCDSRQALVAFIKASVLSENADNLSIPSEHQEADSGHFS